MLKMSVSLRVPTGKRLHIQTGQMKELKKGITSIGLGMVQGEQQGMGECHGQEAQARRVRWRDWLSKPRESSYWERVPHGRGGLQ